MKLEEVSTSNFDILQELSVFMGLSLFSSEELSKSLSGDQIPAYVEKGVIQIKSNNSLHNFYFGKNKNTKSELLNVSVNNLNFIKRLFAEYGINSRANTAVYISYYDDASNLYRTFLWCFDELESTEFQHGYLLIEFNPYINSIEAKNHFENGNINFEKKSYYEAIDCYKTAISLNANFKDAYHKLAELYIEIGDYVKSISTCIDNIELDPYDEIAHYYLGVSYLRLEMYDKAIKSFKEIIDFNPESSIAYYALGIIYNYQNEELKLNSVLYKLKEINYDLYLKLNDNIN